MRNDVIHSGSKVILARPVLQACVKVEEVTDQQWSTGQLREAMAGREGEELDWEQEQQSLQLQVELGEEASQHLQVRERGIEALSFSWCVQELLSAELERKEPLGVELSAVREEVGQWKSKHRSAGEELCS